MVATRGVRLSTFGRWTPSPVPPPLVKARVAVHPLPQGGEGWDFCLGGVLKEKLLRPDEVRPGSELVTFLRAG